MRILIGLALILGFPQESPVDRWIADLAHEDVSRRDEAQRHLVRAGKRILPQIQAALKRGGDATTGALLVKVERAILDADERRRDLSLVTLDAGAMRLGDFMEAIEAQTGHEIVSEVHPDLRVNVEGKDQPLRQVLDSVERQLGVTIQNRESSKYRVKRGRIDRPDRIHLPGATFDLRKHAVKEDGRRVGWVVEVKGDDLPDADVESIEIEDSEGRPLQLERCRRCSPNRVLVRTESAILKVRARIETGWNQRTTLEVKTPGMAQVFQVGNFKVRYEFLRVLVTSDFPVDGRLFPDISITVERRNGDALYSGRFGRTTSCGHWHPEWCRNLPYISGPRSRNDQPTKSEAVFEYHDKDLVLADVKSVEVYVRRPVRETYQAEVTLR
jgi:hypothetical protein